MTGLSGALAWLLGAAIYAPLAEASAPPENEGGFGADAEFGTDDEIDPEGRPDTAPVDDAPTESAAPEVQRPQSSPAPSPPPQTGPSEPARDLPPATAPDDTGTRSWSPDTGQVEAPPPRNAPVPPPPDAATGARADGDSSAKKEGPRRRGKKGNGRWGFSQDMIWPRVGLGASFGSFNHTIGIGVGATYMFWFGIGLGLDFDDTITIFRDRAKAEFPGIEKDLPTNVAELTPHLQWIMLPGFNFTPYVRAGVGPVFYNNDLGTLGQWKTSAGFMFRIRGRLFVDLGATVSAQFPDARFREVWTYQDQPPLCGISDETCSLQIAPRIGLSFGFGIPVGRR